VSPEAVQAGEEETELKILPLISPKEETRDQAKGIVVETVMEEMEEMEIEETMEGLPPKLPPELWTEAGAERDEERDLKAVKANNVEVPIWL
jgi:hypothetical protein